ncbi:hypothetical protein H8356DRAFT_1311450 [Neocallimastix lanati (nom. inval.)]|uniref:Uncharacterized protein n=1 Tax=Neocallimastix californiae TaxID=1754190 RepID=A0A1Y2DRW6_9FUNG|nr:hypothetical protein H8356DRAFT_1311450 [Neocallimastix sp. JGI-2020a]ORY61987.1 hypothetical protein LY90DRAFT_505453 [Neocallimastix californiae]|eukprot:ORY61987.1 hypothetical protein LY90DRAFT_505453 [Neocallimastix californiae]
MAIVRYIFLFLLYLSYIKVSNGVNIGENSIEYDSFNKFEYKVGEEITFFKYTDIKGIRSDECIAIYEAILYYQDNSPASYIDYYFSSFDTIVAIIPDVPPSNDYSIAFKIGSYYSDTYLYSHRFKIIPGGKIKKMPSHIDACGYKRVSIYGEDIPKQKTKAKTKKGKI